MQTHDLYKVKMKYRFFYEMTKNQRKVQLEISFFLCCCWCSSSLMISILFFFFIKYVYLGFFFCMLITKEKNSILFFFSLLLLFCFFRAPKLLSKHTIFTSSTSQIAANLWNNGNEEKQKPAKTCWFVLFLHSIHSKVSLCDFVFVFCFSPFFLHSDFRNYYFFFCFSLLNGSIDLIEPSFFFFLFLFKMQSKLFIN